MIRLTLALLVLLVGSCAEGPAVSSDSTARHHTRLLELLGDTITTADGGTYTSDYLAGKKNVFLYLSAKWCPPCRKFTPSLVKFVNEEAGDDVAVLLVSSDRTKAAMEQYMQDYEMPFHAVDYDKCGGIQKAWGGRGIPNLVWLGPDDEVIKGSYDKGGKYVGPSSVLKAFRSQTQ